MHLNSVGSTAERLRRVTGLADVPLILKVGAGVLESDPDELTEGDVLEAGIEESNGWFDAHIDKSCTAVEPASVRTLGPNPVACRGAGLGIDRTRGRVGQRPRGVAR